MHNSGVSRRENAEAYVPATRAPDAAQRHKRVHARLSTRYVSRRGALLIRGPYRVRDTSFGGAVFLPQNAV
jgi:hypothetical protein